MLSKELFPNETRIFYKSLFKIVLPITLQNLISAAVNSADVIMLSKVGQTSIAAVSLAGQVQFVLLLFFVGLSSGLIMLTAQYWGKQDAHSIETLTGRLDFLGRRVLFSVGHHAYLHGQKRND